MDVTRYMKQITVTTNLRGLINALEKMPYPLVFAVEIHRIRCRHTAHKITDGLWVLRLVYQQVEVVTHEAVTKYLQLRIKLTVHSAVSFGGAVRRIKVAIHDFNKLALVR